METNHQHAVTWVEIPVRDMQRAQKFYEQIFGFKMTKLDLNESFSLCLFPVEEGGVGAALCQNETFYIPTTENGPIVYLNANPDVQIVLDRVEDAGGSILLAKRHVSDTFGYMSLIKDSEGNRIALHSLH
jgi:predicted enzyme related to lactoylglutathione lyase